MKCSILTLIALHWEQNLHDYVCQMKISISLFHLHDFTVAKSIKLITLEKRRLCKIPLHWLSIIGFVAKSQFLISNLTKSDLNSIVKFKFQFKNLRHLRRYLNFKFELKFEKKDKELAIRPHTIIEVAVFPFITLFFSFFEPPQKNH